VDWTGGTNPGYGVFDPAEVVQAVRFKVKLEEGGASSYFVTFSAGVSGSYSNREARYGSEALVYQVYDSSGSQRTVLKALPSAIAGEVLSGTLTYEGEIQELTYHIVVTPSQIRGAGNYTDSFILTLYSGALEVYTEEDSRTVAFAVPVTEITGLSLLASGAPFDPEVRSALMDFGTLQKDDQRQLDLRVRSNAGYRVTLESENSGALRHTKPGVATVVPYTLRFAGAIVNLELGPQTPVLQPGRITDANGDVYDIAVTIGSVSGAVAGSYRDVITITVASEN
jgi:spore coat protein U-like protein